MQLFGNMKYPHPHIITIMLYFVKFPADVLPKWGTLLIHLKLHFWQNMVVFSAIYTTDTIDRVGMYPGIPLPKSE